MQNDHRLERSVVWQPKREVRKEVQREVVKKEARRDGQQAVDVQSAASAVIGRDEIDCRHAKFIQQSFCSNYCGVYATGMFLSLLGYPMTRLKALNLFKLKRSNPDYRGATHEEIGEVLSRIAKFRCLHWQYYKRFDFKSLYASVNSQLKVNRQPTLLSFGAIHKNGRWTCTHAVVVVGVKENLIEVLDPLAKPPVISSGANICLYGGSPKLVSVIGSRYTIDLKSEAAVLRWAEKRTSCLEAE